VGPEWYLPDTEAAKLLDCHRRDVRELAQRGILRYIVTPDGKLKISRESVYKLLSLHS
jgi:excisionase family DNA binding protein